MRIAVLLAIASLLQPTPSMAHGAMPLTPDAAAAAWTADPWILLPLLVAHWLYARGRRHLARGRHDHLPVWRSAAFLAAEATIILALLSPLAALSGTLLSAHMVQHGLLLTVVPWLLVVSRASFVLYVGLPRPLRHRLARSVPARRTAQMAAWFAQPWPAAIAHVTTMWLWHVPALFVFGASDEMLHRLEHMSLLVPALLFWSAVVTSERRVALLGACFTVMVLGGLLGALMTLAPVPIYGTTMATWLWGLSPIEDQQLAGLIMWVLVGLPYLAACLIAVGKLVQPRTGAFAHA